MLLVYVGTQMAKIRAYTTADWNGSNINLNSIHFVPGTFRRRGMTNEATVTPTVAKAVVTLWKVDSSL